MARGGGEHRGGGGGRWAAALLAALVGGCGQPLQLADADDRLGLFRRAALAPGAEVHTAESLLAVAQAAARDRTLSSGVTVTVVPLGQEGDSRRPRVLFGRVDEPWISSLLSPLGFEIDGQGFRWLDRVYLGPDDALALTVPDPQRPGLPLGVVAGNRIAPLRHAGALLQPWSEPRFELWRAGELELAGRFTGRWPCRAVLEVDRSAALVQDPPWREQVVRELRLRLDPTGPSDQRLADYLTRLAAAKRRALAVAGADPRDVPMQVVVHGSPEAMFARRQRVELGAVSPIGGHLDVLVAEDLPDDGGRAACEAAVTAVLGTPAHPWLLDGLGVYATGRWLDWVLEEWVAVLQEAGVAPTVAELVRDELPPLASPHLYGPLRGFLFRQVLEERGADGVRELWTGAATLEVEETLEQRFRTALEANLRRYLAPMRPARTAALEQNRELRGLRGVRLLPPPATDGLLSADGTRALEDLAELGANTLLVPVSAYVTGAAARRGEYPADRRDLELWLFARRAAARGFTVGLQPDLHVSPSGIRAGLDKLPSLADWGRFFDQYDSFALHYALLAELSRAPLLMVGTDLGEAASTVLEPVADEHRLDELGQRTRRRLPPAERARAEAEAQGRDARNAHNRLRGERWAALLGRLRPLYSGLLTYGAESPVEREKVGFWRALDLAAQSVAVPLEPKLADDPRTYVTTVAPTAAELRSRLVTQVSQVAQAVRPFDRPALLLGLGFPARSDAWRTPYLRLGEPDPVAARLHGVALDEALDQTFERYPELAGAILGDWVVDPRRRSELAGGFDLREGRDPELLRQLFGAP
jgi:hypothetical protein